MKQTVCRWPLTGHSWFLNLVRRTGYGIWAILWVMLSGQAFAAIPGGAKDLSEADRASVQAQIRAHQHRALGDPEQGYHAHNHRLGLAQQYSPDGRTEIRSPHLQIALQLLSYGYHDPLVVEVPVLSAKADAQGAVVQYQWDNNLREWWHNHPGTLEQWFELSQRPAKGDGTPLGLQLALHLPGETPVTLDPAGQVLLVGEGPAALRYAGLRVWDAEGRRLPARMHLEGSHRLSLRIEDAEARYPITIDPSLSQQAYLKASNTETDDRFGSALAISDDTLVVGVKLEDSSATGINGDQTDNSAQASGAAYVFVRNAGVWSQQAYLKASNTGANDQFGFAVAISGDTLVVGAPSEDSNATGVDGNQADNSAPGSGAAYVFVRNAGVWSQQAYLKASNTEANDEFGSAVTISGDTLVVGAPSEDSNATGVNGNQADNSALNSGAAYAFRFAAGVWSPDKYLKASNTGAGDEFGSAVAYSGHTLVVGAPREDSNATGVNGNQADNSAESSGAAYVFTNTVGPWNYEAYLKASNTEESDSFGSAVAISGDTTLVVGARLEDSNATGVDGNQADNSALNSGAAYVFVLASGVWSQQAYLKASNTGAGDNFGSAVGFSGNTLVIGAPAEDSNATGVDGDQADNSAAGSGAAYVFVRNAGVWSQQAYLKASNTEEFDGFGIPVAISGNTLVVGAYEEDSNATGVNGDQTNNSASASGAAYVFQLTATIGGTLSGLSGGSVTLQNNGGDDVTLNANGAFSFVTPVGLGGSYNVSVLTQPSGQTCTVSNGAGTATTDVTDVQVSCVASYTIGGTLSGLSGSVTLQNNGGDDVTPNANGNFSFATPVVQGGGYNVTVLTQPAGQTCTVSNGAGTATANVTNVAVTCTFNSDQLAELIITVDVIGFVPPGLQFNFTTQGLSPAAFSLQDNQSRSFSNLIPGQTYVVHDHPPPGWTLDEVICSAPPPVCVPGSVTVQPNPSQVVTGTFRFRFNVPPPGPGAGTNGSQPIPVFTTWGLAALIGLMVLVLGRFRPH